MSTKRRLAQAILNELSNDRLNIDFHIDEREVFLRMDQEVNQMARTSFFENWQVAGAFLDNQFITEWSGDDAIDVVDTEDQPSHLILPASYIELPRNAGIQEIWPLEYGPYNQSVIIVSHGELRLYQNNKAGNMQHRLYGYPAGANKFVFSESGVAERFSAKFGVRLAIRDSSMIAADAPYGIPADKEKALIMILVDWFRKRIAFGSDKVRDSNTVNSSGVETARAITPTISNVG